MAHYTPIISNPKIKIDDLSDQIEKAKIINQSSKLDEHEKEMAHLREKRTIIVDSYLGFFTRKKY